MKKRFIAISLAVVLSLSITGCDRPNTMPEEDYPVGTVSVSEEEIKSDKDAKEDAKEGAKEDAVTSASFDTESRDADSVEEMRTDFTDVDSDYMVLYGPVLCTVYKALTDRDFVIPDEDGYNWILDVLSYQTSAVMLGKVGYTLYDINQDFTPELIITDDTGFSIYAVYNLVDSKPHLLLEGWARSRMSYMGGGSFLNEGSDGAMYTIVAQYDYPADGKDAKIKDYYFTYEKDENFNVGFYHNTAGISDKDVSEEISEEEFYLVWDELNTYVVPIPDIIKLTDTSLSVDYASDLQDFKEVIRYEDPSLSEYASQIIFYAEEDLLDIKLLSLEALEFDYNGYPVFSVTKTYDYGALVNGAAALATVEFGETVPVVGVEITERNGVVRKFAVDINGEDGSVYMWEF